MDAGETEIEPGVAIPPMPLSISAEPAFVTAPQFNVVELPAVIDVDVAVNEAMFGVPEQPAGAGAELLDAGGRQTLMLTPMAWTESTPLALRICH